MMVMGEKPVRNGGKWRQREQNRGNSIRCSRNGKSRKELGRKMKKVSSGAAKDGGKMEKWSCSFLVDCCQFYSFFRIVYSYLLLPSTLPCFLSLSVFLCCHVDLELSAVRGLVTADCTIYTRLLFDLLRELLIPFNFFLKCCARQTNSGHHISSD